MNNPNMYPTVEDTIAYVLMAFYGKKDKAGQPYIYHLLRGMLKLEKDDYKVVYLLHDIIEDTDITKEGLKAKGYADDIISDVVLLTHPKGEPYSDYIKRIIESGSERALKVKLTDLEDNMSPDRLEELAMEVKDRLTKKYTEAKAVISEAYDKLVGIISF